MLRKAAALKAFVAFLDARYAGNMDDLRAAAIDHPHVVRDELLALLSVGPETADAILLYALDAPAMVVDEYLRRIATRHRLLPENAKYAAIQFLAEQAFAPDAPISKAPSPSPATTTSSTPSSSTSANPTVAASPAARAAPSSGTRTKIPARSRPPHKMKPCRLLSSLPPPTPASSATSRSPLPKAGSPSRRCPASTTSPLPPKMNPPSSATPGSRRILQRLAPGYVLADDSGLEVDALGGEPGVRSARFADDAGYVPRGSGPQPSLDARNILYLLSRSAASPSAPPVIAAPWRSPEIAKCC